MINQQLFTDIGFSQRTKHGQNICGDVFKYSQIPEEQRLVSVLSDGLGSGIKANIQASMCSTMALKFVTENMEMLHSADIIMQALPECQVRHISYATFTIVDTNLNRQTRIVEMGNPQFILLRNQVQVEIPYKELKSKKWENRDLRFYDFKIQVNDRLIFFSDGITQAGIGSNKYPIGWRADACGQYLAKTVKAKPELSAHELADCVIREALCKEKNYQPADDMSCAVFYFRKPRKMLLFSGPPFDHSRDAQCAKRFDSFAGDKIIAGGTSSEIIARELKKKITLDTISLSHNAPPISMMEGVDLVCEGVLTLTRVAELLEDNYHGDTFSPAGKMIEIFLRNDVITFLVGTRINEAYQDPGMSTELEYRRNIIKRIAKDLKENFLKEINIEYI
jgi:Stage II sporulation protein E (SpoIIE)